MLRLYTLGILFLFLIASEETASAACVEGDTNPAGCDCISGEWVCLDEDDPEDDPEEEGSDPEDQDDPEEECTAFGLPPAGPVRVEGLLRILESEEADQDTYPEYYIDFAFQADGFLDEQGKVTVDWGNAYFDGEDAPGPGDCSVYEDSYCYSSESITLNPVRIYAGLEGSFFVDTCTAEVEFSNDSEEASTFFWVNTSSSACVLGEKDGPIRTNYSTDRTGGYGYGEDPSGYSPGALLVTKSLNHKSEYYFNGCNIYPWYWTIDSSLNKDFWGDGYKSESAPIELYVEFYGSVINPQ